jgi:Flp pilus assembly protein TadG
MTKRRGAALVEFAIVVPLLMMLLMGIMEFGMILHDYLSISQGAREGVREAAVGSPQSKVRGRVMRASLPAITPEMIQVHYYDEAQGRWVDARDDSSGTSNLVPPKSLIRVRVANYPHRLITGSFFAWLPGVQGSVLPLTGGMTMRRE